MDPAGGFEALHRRQLAAVGLVILYHQRHAAVAEDIAQLIQLLIVEEMAKGELQPQSVQSLRFREQRREIRVKLAVVGEQRLRRGVAGQQAVALNGGRQRGQSVELFRAAQLAADFDAVRATALAINGRTAACPPKDLTWSLPYAAVTTIIFLAIALLLPAFVA